LLDGPVRRKQKERIESGQRGKIKERSNPVKSIRRGVEGEKKVTR